VKRPGHPSDRKLGQWIAGSDTTLDRHLASCSYCADRLESVHGESGEAIGEALRQLLSVPEELPERLRTGIDERIANRRDLTLIGEFFGLPLRTVRVFSSSEQEDE